MSTRNIAPKRRSLIKYGDRECPRAVFNKGRFIPEKDPREWRKCRITGKPIRFSHHGKKTEFGWDMDHKIPVARNGSDYLCNLIPVLLSVNRSQGASYKNKPQALIEQHEAIYIQRGIQRRYKNLDFKWSDDIKANLLQ